MVVLEPGLVARPSTRKAAVRVWLAGASSVPQSRACARSQLGSVNRGANAANTAPTSAGGVNIGAGHFAGEPPVYSPVATLENGQSRAKMFQFIPNGRH